MTESTLQVDRPTANRTEWAIAMLSMTGFGEARRQSEQMMVRVEVRSVNNRHLKVAYRLPEGYAGLESKLESVVRKHVHRGSLLLNLQVERAAVDEPYRLNEAVLVHYHQQIAAIAAKLQLASEVRLAELLQLPGTITETARASAAESDAEWSLVEATLVEALERLNQMRLHEGAALEADLRASCETIQVELDQIVQRAPAIVKAYEVRLLDRINQLLGEYNLQADPGAIVREVGVFADRADISEESVRLRSHLKQFEAVMRTERHSGRKLDFLIQELLREANTIGSKANDAQIARHVVQIKTSIERLREMIQNVE